jgi:hypothetical protein
VGKFIKTPEVLSSVGIDSMLLAVLPDRKTGGKDTVLSSSFAYTWNRLKRYWFFHLRETYYR